MKKLFSILLCLTMLLLSSCAPPAAPSSDGTAGLNSDAVSVGIPSDNGASTEKELPQNPPLGPQIYTYDSETRKVLSQEELNAVVGEDVKGAWIFEDSEQGDEIAFSAAFPGPYPGSTVENAVPPLAERTSCYLNGTYTWGRYLRSVRAPNDAGMVYHLYEADGQKGNFGLTEDGVLCFYLLDRMYLRGSKSNPNKAAQWGTRLYQDLSGTTVETIVGKYTTEIQGCVLSDYDIAYLPEETFSDGTLFPKEFLVKYLPGNGSPHTLNYFPREHSDEVKALPISTVGIDAALREARYMVEQQGKEFCRASARYVKFFYGADGEAYGVYEVSFALSDRLPQLVTDCLVACRLTGSDAVS